MNKLPVFATVGTAYAFVYSRFPTILRLEFFPLLVVALVGFVAFVLGAAGPQSPGIYQALQIILQVVVATIVAVAMHRLILFNDRRPGTVVFFNFGRAELLFVVVWVIFFLILIVAGVLVIALAAMFSQTGPTPSPFLAVVAFVVFLAGIFLLLRFILIFPIIVAEGSLHFRESWRLTRGNLWRLLGIAILGLLPIAVVAAGLGLIINWTLLDHSSTEALAASAREALPYDLVLQFALSLISAPLGVALICYPYKALKGIPADGTVSEPVR
jgi:hypothetical protein